VAVSTQPHTKLFTQVDRTKDPDFFVRFMDEAQRPEGIQASEQLMLERMGLTPGVAVLEVGCGPLQHADNHGTLLVSFTTFIVVGARN
jgi:hypothetical protein